MSWCLKKFIISWLLLFLLHVALMANDITISIKPKKVTASIPSTLTGTGMEDVNHEIYGGLDAQRLFGESFEEEPVAAQDYSRLHSVSSSWIKSEQSNDACFYYDKKIFHYGSASQSLDARGGTIAIANMGLNNWGIPIKKGKEMIGYIHVYGKVDKLEVGLEDRDGIQKYSSLAINTINDTLWHRHTFRFTPNHSDAKARFYIRAEGNGRVWLDDVYLADAPTNELGRIGCREDIAAAFQEEKLQYLRWGGSMVNVKEYNLTHLNGQGNRLPYNGYWYPKSSGGFGPYEFVRMASAMNLPCAVSISRDEKVNDAIAFAQWLKQFNIPICVEIGNEECVSWFNEANIESYRRYLKNVKRLVEPMRKVNDKLTFASAAWWVDSKLEWMEECFKATDGIVEYWDIHVNNPDVKTALKARKRLTAVSNLIQRLNPKSKMKIAIFEENANNHSLERALAHAVTMTIVREFGNNILCCCGANALQPYLQNDNWWDQGQIFFTPDKVWLQPYGYAKQMEATYYRDLLIASQCNDSTIYISATKNSKDESVVLHIVNPNAEVKTIDVKGMKDYKLIKAISLDNNNIRANNTPKSLFHVCPQDVTDDFNKDKSLKPHSYTILEFSLH